MDGVCRRYGKSVLRKSKKKREEKRSTNGQNSKYLSEV
ncbi:mCG1035096 [Mus musculus]|nr:mCG1035096 [Mus musculus]